nr:hypothetical protein [Tanacetum cinerariifolium]
MFLVKMISPNFLILREDIDSNVEEDTMSSSEFLDDLYVEFRNIALLANQKRFYKRLEELVLVGNHWDEGFTRVKAFTDIAEDEPAVGKTDARSGTSTPLPKLSRAKPIGTSNDVIPHADLIQTSTVFDKTKHIIENESSVKIIKKMAHTKTPLSLTLVLKEKVTNLLSNFSLL